MIEFNDVTKIYSPEIVALKNVSFGVNRDEFVIISGKSGAGKTTLIKLLLAEEKPTKGEIICSGINVHKVKPRHLFRLRRKIGVVFQDYKLFPTKTAFENVAYGMEIMGATLREINRDVPKVLEIVDMEARANNFPPELSGGEKQRIAIARALAHRPQIIVADEPTGNLDPYHTHDIIQLFEKIHNMGTTILLATHDKDIVDTLRERVITLNQGTIMRDEKPGRFIL